MGSRAGGATKDLRLRVRPTFAIIVGVVGAAIFFPMAVAWPLDMLRQGRLDEDGPVAVTVIGWSGLALIARFVFRSRVVVTTDTLVEQRFLFSRRIPLAAVTSIDRCQGKVARQRIDDLYLFRGHPQRPWVVDLEFVAGPERLLAELRARCKVTFADYTPQTAPPWLRG